MENIKKELLIAKKALAESKLTDAVSDIPLIVEMYCYQAIGSPTFFAQLYKGQGEYHLLYARTLYAEYRGIRSISQTFETVEKAKQHCAKVGNIICGLQAIRGDHSFLADVLSVLPDESERQVRPSGFVLDGGYTYIKKYEKDAEAFFCGDNLISQRFSEIIGKASCYV